MTRFTLSRLDLIRARFALLVERISLRRNLRRAATIFDRIKSEGRMR